LLNERSGESHVQRQSKARSEKLKKSFDKKTGKLKVPLPAEYSKGSGDDEAQTIENIPYGENFEIDTSRFINLEDEYDTDGCDELAIEILERERKEWHRERIKLVHCIHQQQLELAQRAAAAHDKATEIAKVERK
jgi:hypothetical protein